MPLTPTQRKLLGQTTRGSGIPADNLHTRTQTNAADTLTASGYTKWHDYSNDGTWTLKATPAGTKLFNTPRTKRDPVRLMYGARMPHPDPLRRGTVPEPELVDPLPADIKRARDEGARQRDSFRADLEEERAKRKRDRVQRMFRAA